MWSVCECLVQGEYWEAEKEAKDEEEGGGGGGGGEDGQRASPRRENVSIDVAWL